MKKSTMVNLYLIKRMLGFETIVETQKSLDESYYNRSYKERTMSYGEYVDYKRNSIANILGTLEYSNDYLF